MSFSFDKQFLYSVIVLAVVGILILGSASMALSQKNFGTIGHYTVRQIVFGGGIGILALLFTQWYDYHKWRPLAVALMVLSFIFLALVFVPHISYQAGGATRWIHFGPVNFQPSEFLKFSFIIYLASWLDVRKGEIGSVSYGMLPFTLMLGVIAVFLLLQPDMGTLGIISVTAGALYFLGGGKKIQLVAFVFFAVLLTYILILIEPYRLQRLLVFLNPNHDPQGAGYQITQALIGIGSGGFWGLGFGKGIQKYNYLPEPMGDSIFAVFAEETGFIGVVLLLAAFGYFFHRGMLIAKKAPDSFGKLLAAGITISIALQALINMAAISGILPLTGIPLPFISYGGTSLVITLASVGILLNISKHT